MYTAATTGHRCVRGAPDGLPLPSAPPCPRGLISYHWIDVLEQGVVCHLEVEPAEAGEREAGMLVSPDLPAVVHLIAAYVCNVDILRLLSDQQVDAIESAVYDQQAEVL